MRKFMIAVAGLATLAAVPAHAATTVFANDFETGFVDPDGTFSTSGSVRTASGAQYEAIGFGGTGNSLTNRFAAFAGGNGQPNPTPNPIAGNLLSATIMTVAGRFYTISFDYGAIGASGDTSQSLFFTASDGGSTPVAQFNFSPITASNDLDSVFTNYTTSFQADGTSVALDFFGIGGVNDNADTLLDNVVVTEAVPEASTWAMMILGLGSVGGAMRRLRRGSSRDSLATA